MLQYDDVDEDVLRNYHEFSLANIIFYGMKESACSEQSARMTSMDNATKNAGKSLFKLPSSFAGFNCYSKLDNLNEVIIYILVQIKRKLCSDAID